MAEDDIEIIIPEDKLRICPKCQTFNPEGSNFCLNCGVTYGARQSSDFAKLTELSSGGRSTDTTILNVLPCTVSALATTRSPAHVLIKLEVSGQSLLARVTRRSCDQLGLSPGLRVYAQIKSVALVA